MRVPQRGWAKTAVVTLAAAGLLLSGIAVLPSASAAPSRDIGQVRDQVRTLQSRAEAATERYNSARNQLADVQDTLSGLQRKVKRERAELQEILSSVDDLARATYTSGGIDTSLQVLLAEDPTEFLAQAAALDQVAQSQASSLRRTQTARLRLAQSEAAVQDKESIAQQYRDEMSDAKNEADQQLGEAAEHPRRTSRRRSASDWRPSPRRSDVSPRPQHRRPQRHSARPARAVPAAGPRARVAATPAAAVQRLPCPTRSPRWATATWRPRPAPTRSTAPA